jgi:hypothetical protein
MRKKTALCRFSIGGLAGLSLVLFSIHSARADFSGYYAPGNFTLTNTNADGSVTSAAPFGITVFGGANASGNPGTTDFTITAPATGTVMFNWAYSTTDIPLLDDAGYLLNGTYIELAPADGLSGPFAFPVMAGDVFGFRVETVDNTEDRGAFTITNFSGPAAVPEPSAVTLTAAGAVLLGVGAIRTSRRRHSA